MSYVENKLHYEDWEVDNDDEDGVSIISIVNDFFEFTSPFYPNTTELMPLQYWINDGGMGYQGSSYEDCVEWIRDNYLNSYKLEK